MSEIYAKIDPDEELKEKIKKAKKNLKPSEKANLPERREIIKEQRKQRKK